MNWTLRQHRYLKDKLYPNNLIIKKQAEYEIKYNNLISMYKYKLNTIQWEKLQNITCETHFVHYTHSLTESSYLNTKFTLTYKLNIWYVMFCNDLLSLNNL